MSLQQTYLICNNERYPHYHCTFYQPVSAGKDSFSHSLLRFKEGKQPDLSGWLDCALESFGSAPIPGGTLIVRALHHYETRLSPLPTALDLLGTTLAEEYHHYYCPRLLQKKTLTLPIKGLTRAERRSRLKDLYCIDEDYAASLPEKSPASILVIDDLLTTGTTARAIIRLLKRFYQRAGVAVFTLARAGAAGRHDQPAILTGPRYQLQQGMSWTRSTHLPKF